MRKIYMMFPSKTSNNHLLPQRNKLAKQLKEQKAINAELLRICEHQSQLLAEQSDMIEEILEGMGK